MRVTQVEYSELMSTGNFSNVKVGVMVELAEGERAVDALDKARAFVRAQFAKNQLTLDWSQGQIEEAKRIVNDPLSFDGHKIDWAKKVVADAQNIEASRRDFDDFHCDRVAG